MVPSCESPSIISLQSFLIISSFSHFCSTIMSATSYRRHLLGDEYLPDMRIRHRDTSFSPPTNVFGLEEELNRMSTRSYGFVERSNGSENLCTFARPANTSKQRKAGSNTFAPTTSIQTATTSSNKTRSSSRNASTASTRRRPTVSSSSSSIFARGNSQSLTGQSHYQVMHNDRQEQVNAIPSQRMLDRWIGQTTRQDPFHGLSSGLGGGRQADSEKQKGKQRASRA